MSRTACLMVRVRARASNRADLSLQNDMVAEQQASLSLCQPRAGGTDRLHRSRIEFLPGTTPALFEHFVFSALTDSLNTELSGLNMQSGSAPKLRKATPRLVWGRKPCPPRTTHRSARRQTFALCRSGSPKTSIVRKWLGNFAPCSMPAVMK